MTTWNLLHRIHAVNWSEPTIDSHPDEHLRIAAVARVVAAHLEGDGVRVSCLQEVSGDQLRALREHLPADVLSFHHRYPRVPRFRSSGSPALDDPAEHLVTLVRGSVAHQAATHTFATDPGKGFLGIALADECAVWNAHVTWGPRGAEQLRTLLTAAQARPGTAVITGDFNADAAAVRAALGPGAHISDLAAQPPTRIGHGGAGKCIDHVIAWRGLVENARVLDGAGLSDHQPVTARVVAERG